MRSTPSLVRSLRLAVAWVFAAAVLGPLAYGIGVTAWLIASGEPFWRTDMLAIPTAVLSMASFGIPSLLVGVPLFAPLLVLWAVLARRWTPLESVGGVLAGTMGLAALGALLLFLSSERDPRPLAPHGLAALPEALQAGGLVWLALVLPRAIIPPLRVGAFARTREHAA
jgi:hypothetical protein